HVIVGINPGLQLAEVVVVGQIVVLNILNGLLVMSGIALIHFIVVGEIIHVVRVHAVGARQVMLIVAFAQIQNAPVLAIQKHHRRTVVLGVHAHAFAQGLHHGVAEQGIHAVVAGVAQQQAVKALVSRVGKNWVVGTRVAVVVAGVEAQALCHALPAPAAVDANADLLLQAGDTLSGFEQLQVRGMLPLPAAQVPIGI